MLISDTIPKRIEIEEKVEAGFFFDVEDPAVVDFLGDRVEFASASIMQTRLDELRATLTTGVANGENVRQLTNRVMESYEGILNKRYQAERIARTETIAASNAGRHQGYQQSGVVKSKVWVSIKNARTRGASVKDKFNHIAADGQEVDFDSPFIVTGEQLNYPGDISLGARAGNIVNCRCTFFAKVKKPEIQKPKVGLSHSQMKMRQLERTIRSQVKTAMDEVAAGFTQWADETAVYMLRDEVMTGMGYSQTDINQLNDILGYWTASTDTELAQQWRRVAVDYYGRNATDEFVFATFPNRRIVEQEVPAKIKELVMVERGFAQEVMAKQGHQGTMTLYRGYTMEASATISDDFIAQQNALSSWTTDRQTAKDFANLGRAKGEQGIVFKADIPIEDIWSAPTTLGNVYQEEYVVGNASGISNVEIDFKYATQKGVVKRVISLDASKKNENWLKRVKEI